MRTFKVGLAIVIVGWLACLFFYTIIFGVPIYMIGVVVVWYSKARKKVKLLTTFLPLVLWYPAIGACMFIIGKRMTPETFLIPKDFRGQITLIYNEPCGQTVPKVHGRLMYRVPSNGIMILTNKFETGFIDQEYYFVDDNWNKVGKIPTLNEHDFNEDYTLEKNRNEPSRSMVGLFLLGTGGGSTAKNENFKFHIMAVDCWDSLRMHDNGNIPHKIADSILASCRGRH